METLARTGRVSTKLGIKLLEAVVEGLVEGALNVLGPEKAQLLVDNDWYIIETMFYASTNIPVEGYKKMKPEEIQKAEQMRKALAKTVLPVLGMAKFVASKFPVEAVEAKVTPEWLIKRGEERFPEIVKVWKDTEEKGEQWLEKQAAEIVGYLTGRIIYSPQQRIMVPIEELKHVAEAAALQRGSS